MSRAVIEGMRARKYGRIVNIGSINGQAGQYGQVNYAAAKSGIHGFTKALAQEGAGHGITVNAICPGPILTGITEDIPDDMRDTFARRRTALRRYGDPEEVAHLTLSLALPAASYITGAIIPVDGGLTAKND